MRFNRKAIDRCIKRDGSVKFTYRSRPYGPLHEADAPDFLDEGMKTVRIIKLEKKEPGLYDAWADDGRRLMMKTDSWRYGHMGTYAHFPRAEALMEAAKAQLGSAG